MKFVPYPIVVVFTFFLILTGGAQAELIYKLSTETTNVDNGQLISGFFKTDGTVGSGIRLGDILEDYLIDIEENGLMAQLNPGNSTVTRNADFFDVTASQISLSSGPGFFQGFAITHNNTGINDPNRFIRYSALRTGADVNVFVSINSGVGTPFSGVNEAVLAAVPEPGSLTMFSIVVLGLTARRKRTA